MRSRRKKSLSDSERNIGMIRIRHALVRIRIMVMGGFVERIKIYFRPDFIDPREYKGYIPTACNYSRIIGRGVVKR